MNNHSHHHLHAKVLQNGREQRQVLKRLSKQNLSNKHKNITHAHLSV